MLSIRRLKQCLSPVALLAQRKLFVRSEGESDRLFVNPCLSLVKKIETVPWFDSGESGEGWNFVISDKNLTQGSFSFQSVDM